MIPIYITRLSVMDFRIRSQRTWHLAQVQHYYRSQIDRIHTLKLHISRIDDPLEREICEGSLSLARTAGGLAARSLTTHVRKLIEVDAVPQLEAKHLEPLYDCIHYSILEMRAAHPLLDQCFELVSDAYAS